MKLFAIVSLFISLNCFALITPFESTLPENSQFKISREMRKRVDFWVKIYSQYSTTQGVFHLVDNPSVVLGEIDVTDIFENSRLTANEKKMQIKNRVTTKKNLILAQHNIKNPRQVRLQMGLRDRMRKAFYLSGKYLKQMEAIFRQEGLPIELTHIIYIKNSFNIYTQSKVKTNKL